MCLLGLLEMIFIFIVMSESNSFKSSDPVPVQVQVQVQVPVQIPKSSDLFIEIPPEVLALGRLRYEYACQRAKELREMYGYKGHSNIRTKD